MWYYYVLQQPPIIDEKFELSHNVLHSPPIIDEKPEVPDNVLQHPPIIDEKPELLDNILEEQEDQTIDPILLKSKTKNKDIKDIAAEMAKERGPIDDKPVMY